MSINSKLSEVKSGQSFILRQYIYRATSNAKKGDFDRVTFSAVRMSGIKGGECCDISETDCEVENCGFFYPHGYETS